MEDRIKEVLANVLGIEKDTINDSTSPDTVKAWDSLKQMYLIIALEDEFGIRLSDEQVIGMLNFKAIKNIMQEVCN